MARRRWIGLLAAFLAAGTWVPTAVPVRAQAWKPVQTVELVVPTAAGSGSDAYARVIEKFMREKKLVDAAVVVVNKPGGGGTIGLVYLNQHPGEGHYLMVTGPTLITNYITGRAGIGPRDITPVAQLGSESVVFAVNADSRIRSARQLADTLRTDPSSLSIAIANSLGNNQHIATGMVVNALGGNVRSLKMVVFNSSGEILTALLGGHVDAIATSAATVIAHHRVGRVRVLAVGSEQRLAPFPEAPTWAEFGVSGVAQNVRIVVGPKGMTAGQLRYWDQVFGRLVKLDEWKRELDGRLVENLYSDSNDAGKAIEKRYDELKVVLSDLGLAR